MANLIKETFAQFHATESSRDTSQSYIKRYGPDQAKKELNRQFGQTPLFYVTEVNNSVVGMIRGEQDRIVNLFVAIKFQRKKIGSLLLRHYEIACEQEGAEIIRVQSSIYAIPFYVSHGYKKTTGVRHVNGLKVQPMKKIIV